MDFTYNGFDVAHDSGDQPIGQSSNRQRTVMGRIVGIGPIRAHIHRDHFAPHQGYAHFQVWTAERGYASLVTLSGHELVTKQPNTTFSDGRPTTDILTQLFDIADDMH